MKCAVNKQLRRRTKQTRKNKNNSIQKETILKNIKKYIYYFYCRGCQPDDGINDLETLNSFCFKGFSRKKIITSA